jgi:hypothetical protein
MMLENDARAAALSRVSNPMFEPLVTGAFTELYSRIKEGASMRIMMRMALSMNKITSG